MTKHAAQPDTTCNSDMIASGPAAPDADQIWQQMRQEAEAAASREPALANFINANVLHRDSLIDAVIHRISRRLGHADFATDMVIDTFRGIATDETGIPELIATDLQAVFDRDPACQRYLDPILYFKGFHALATHRFAHAIWQAERTDLAFYLQSQASKIFATDIHPAARFGRGIMLDHATGIVIGETAVVGDNVSMLHAVTLGGSGKQTGDRHPKVGAGVLIGAGAKVLGNIHIGNCCLIASGSVVLNDIPPHKTVAGVPAKIVGSTGTAEPAQTMEQQLGPDDYACL